jgi:hypothetical protein
MLDKFQVKNTEDRLFVEIDLSSCLVSLPARERGLKQLTECIGFFARR